MREAMTEQLRLALETAQAQARQLNNDFVGTEHLLLGLLAANHASDGESEAVRALRRSEISLEELRESLVKALPRHAESPVVAGQLPHSPNAKRAVNAAIVGAQAMHEPRVSTRLMLRALLEDPESEIRASLRACGADLDRLQNTVDAPAQHPED
jgi:ATP-dependent Clp protease ATP-binding subunit ClpC